MSLNNSCSEVVAALGLERNFKKKDAVYLLMKQTARRGKAPKVYLACGTENFLVYGHNNELYEFLKTMPCASEYEAWSGVYAWNFWNVARDKFLEYTVGLPEEDNVFGGIPPYVKKNIKE